MPLGRECSPLLLHRTTPSEHVQTSGQPDAGRQPLSSTPKRGKRERVRERERKCQKDERIMKSVGQTKKVEQKGWMEMANELWGTWPDLFCIKHDFYFSTKPNQASFDHFKGLTDKSTQNMAQNVCNRRCSIALLRDLGYDCWVCCSHCFHRKLSWTSEHMCARAECCCFHILDWLTNTRFLSCAVVGVNGWTGPRCRTIWSKVIITDDKEQ